MFFSFLLTCTVDKHMSILKSIELYRIELIVKYWFVLLQRYEVSCIVERDVLFTDPNCMNMQVLYSLELGKGKPQVMTSIDIDVCTHTHTHTHRWLV